MIKICKCDFHTYIVSFSMISYVDWHRLSFNYVVIEFLLQPRHFINNYANCTFIYFDTLLLTYITIYSRNVNNIEILVFQKIRNCCEMIANRFHIYNRNTYHILHFAIALVSQIYIKGEINANQKLLRCNQLVSKCDLKKILLRRSLYAKCAVYSTQY